MTIPHCASFAIVLTLALVSLTTISAGRSTPYVRTTLLPALDHGKSYIPGQEIRIKLSTYGYTNLTRFNVSAGKSAIRIISAYANRAQSGPKFQSCNDTTLSAASVWQTVLDVSAKAYHFGNEYATTVSATFTVPPFPWRVCMGSLRDVSKYVEVADQIHVKHGYNASVVAFWHAGTIFEGDHAEIRIVTFDAWGYRRRYPNSDAQETGDNVKFVPAGMPCSHEKSTSRDGVGSAHYCGSNQVGARGVWRTTQCMFEGSVTAGVPKIGSTTRNPYIQHFPEGAVPYGQDLVGFLTAPRNGHYDICYSPVDYRMTLMNQTEASPVWFKLFELGKNGCGTSRYTSDRTCTPTDMRITVRSQENRPVYWSTLDASEGSWGTVRIRAETSTLSAEPSVSWDCYGCNATNYGGDTGGGDMIRLVPVSKFGDVAAATAGTMLATVVTEASYASSGESLVIQNTGTPSVGTSRSYAGCWYNAGDNYGPTGQALHAAVDVLLGEARESGVSASGDLGSALPFSSESAQYTSGSSLGATYAYLRLPSTGQRYYVCYRRGGRDSWQIAKFDNTVDGDGRSGGTNALQSTGALGRNVTYHINDTRAGTYGEFVLMGYPLFNTMPNTFYGSSSATWASIMSVVSAATASLRIVSGEASCQSGTIVAQSHDAGMHECSIAKCTGVTPCTGCAGRLESSATLRSSVVFHLRVPAAGTFYRVCFRRGAYNWHEIEDPSTISVIQQKATTRKFVPKAPSGLTGFTSDRMQDTVALFRFKQAHGAVVDAGLDVRPAHVNGDGDVFRLLPNQTSTGAATRCDLSWPASIGDVTSFNLALTATNLGVWCAPAMPSTLTARVCNASRLTPKINGISGTYPYSDIDTTTDAALPGDLGSVAVISMPPPLSDGLTYRLCYKQAHRNWADVALFGIGPNLDVLRGPTLSASFQHYTKLYTGSFVFGTLSAAQGYTFNPTTSIVKLVSDSFSCDRETAGLTEINMGFASSTYPNSNLYITDASGNAGQDKPVRSGRVYLRLPTPQTTIAAVFKYKVCFRATQSPLENWRELSTLSVEHLGITFTADNEFTHGAVESIDIIANETQTLNTTANGDAFKLVEHGQVCVDGVTAASVPTNTTSTMFTSKHVGLEMAHDTDSAKIAGVTDVGSGDIDRALHATVVTTLPISSLKKVHYTVCYKPFGRPWMTIGETRGSKRVYPYPGGLYARYVARRNVQLSANLFSQSQTPNEMGVATTMVLPGVSTVLLAETSRLQNITTTISSASQYYFRLTGEMCTTSDELKFVQTATYTETWREIIPRHQCDSTAYNSQLYKPILVHGHCQFVLDMPAIGGAYIMCYRQTGLSRWTQLEASFPNTTAVRTPLYVTAPKTGFIPGAAAITVKDSWMQGLTSLASLSFWDYIYIINATGACGYSNPYRSYSTSTAYELPYNVTQLNASTSMGKMYSSALSTVDNPPANKSLPAFYPIPSTVQRNLKVCYFKQVAHTRVEGMASVWPFMQGGMWYHIPNVGTDISMGGGTPFLSTSQAVALQVDCSAYNSSTIVTAGSTIFFDVSVVDKTNAVVARVGESYGITATTNFDFKNAGGKCSASDAVTYGLPSNNGRQFSTEGRVRFALTPLSLCSSSLCSVSFVSTGSLSSSATCHFRIRPNAVAALRVVQGVSTCKINTHCVFRIVSLRSDGEIEYTSRDAISVVHSAHPGLTVDMAYPNGQGQGLVQGAFTLSITPKVDPSTAASWLETNHHNLNITFMLGGNGGLSVSTFVQVQRDSLQFVRIVGVQAVSYAGLPANEPELNRIPDWVPSATFPRGEWGSGQRLAATADHFLVAGTYYRVTLEAMRDSATPMPTGIWTSHLKISLQSPHIKNKIIGTYVGAENRSYDGDLVPVPLDGPKVIVVFRLKNSFGCTRGDGGCKILFKFNGVDVGGETYIHTHVRSKATSLKVECSDDSNVCAPSTVETGVPVTITAVDQFGNTDEYFEGDILVLAKGGIDNITYKAGLGVTTADRLRTNEIGAIPMRHGYLTTALTTTRPCVSGCTVMLASTWGTLPAEVTITTLPSSHHLECGFSSRHYALTEASAVFNASERIVEGWRSKDTPNPRVLIYPGNTICTTAWAANTTGGKTFYETLWTTFRVTWMGSPARIEVVNGGSRIQPMSRSATEFCFRVTPFPEQSAANDDNITFHLHFSTQRFAYDSSGSEYWSRSRGECTMSNVVLRLKRSIAQLRVTDVTGMHAAVRPEYGSPVQHAWYYQYHSELDRRLEITTKIGYVDHYGKAITQSELHVSPLRPLYVSPESCNILHLQSFCHANDADVTEYGHVNVQHMWGPSEGGRITAHLSSHQVWVGSNEVFFRFLVTRWCVRCTLTFTLKQWDGDKGDVVVLDRQHGGGVNATLSMSIVHDIRGNLTRYIAFKQSPVYPAAEDAASYMATPWRHYLINNSTQQLWFTPNVGNIIFDQRCFSQSTCFPHESILMRPQCHPDGNTKITLSGKDLELYVLSSARPSMTNAIKYAQVVPSTDYTTHMHLTTDIDVLVAVETQQLVCHTAACKMVNGNVFVTVPGYGVNVSDAVYNAYMNYSSGPRTSSFQLEGLRASKYYDSFVPGVSLVRGAFTATSTSMVNTTGITTAPTGSGDFSATYHFAWSAEDRIIGLKVLDSPVVAKCNGDRTTTQVYTSPQTSGYDGYPKYGVLEDIQVRHDKLPVGQYFPISLQALNTKGMRAVSAFGTVTADLYQWDGCNTGGSIIVRESSRYLTDGVAQVWVRLTAPCQRCILRFTLSLNAAVSHLLPAALSPLTALTGMMDVLDITSERAGTVVVDVSATTSPAKHITLTSPITIKLQAQTNVSGLPFNDVAVDGTIRAYNVLKDASATTWYGNGGILRSSPSQPNFDPTLVLSGLSNGYASITLYYQRPCRRCAVLILWELPSSGATGSFYIKNALGTTDFVVTAIPTHWSVFGAPPLYARARSPVTLALWTASNEGGILGVNSGSVDLTGFGTQLSVRTTALDTANGGGGVVVTSELVRLVGLSVWSIQFSLSCDNMRIAIGDSTINMPVFTTATRLSLTSFALHASTDITRTYRGTLVAMDDYDYVDHSYGGFTTCHYFSPFVCNVQRKTVSVAYDFSNTTRYLSDELHTGCREQFSLTPHAAEYPFSISSGKATVDTILSEPCRDAFLQFSTDNGTITSVPSRANVFTETFPGNMTLSTDQEVYTVAAGVQVPIHVGVVNPRYFVKYVARGVSGTVKANTTENCISGAVMSEQALYMGMTTFRYTFKATGTTSTTCRVTFTTSACNDCTITRTVNVLPRTISRWGYVNPTPLNNGGRKYGPMYGAMNRPMKIGVQTFMDLSDGTSIPVECADCQMEILTAGCSTEPQFPATTALNASGFGEATVLWGASSTRRSYTCRLNIKVRTASGYLIGPQTLQDTSVSENPFVEVCSPSTLYMNTNVSSVLVNQLGALHTGVPYNFTVQIRDPFGERCRGDTQDSASLLTVDVVQAYGNVVEERVKALNVPSGTTVLNPVRAQAGEYTFTVRFTASTAALQISGVRLRVRADTAYAPALTTPMAFSSVFPTIIVPHRLRFDPALTVASNTVTNFTVIELRAQVIDDLNVPEWAAIAPNVPNVAKDVSLDVALTVSSPNSLVELSNVPLSFSQGGFSSRTTAGIVNFAFKYMGFDASLCFTVGAVLSKLLPSSTVCTTLRRVTHLVRMPIASAYFTISNEGVWVISSGTVFRDVVRLSDVTGAAVVGDVGSIIGVRVHDRPTTIVVGLVNSSTDQFSSEQVPAVYNTSRAGVVEFNLRFLGTTEDSSLGVHRPVRLEYFCANIPGNPCLQYTITPLYSERVQVQSNATSTQSRPISVMLPLNIPLSSVVASKLKRDIISLLSNKTGTEYLRTAADSSFVKVFICSVVRSVVSYRASLSSMGVCGSAGVCTTANEASCPSGVVQCLCDAALSTQRRLLQAAPTTAANTSTHVEVRIDLSASTSLTETKRNQANSVLSQALITEAVSGTNPVLAQYGIDVNNVQQISVYSDPTATPDFSTPTRQPLPTLSPGSRPVTSAPYDDDPTIVAAGALPQLTTASKLLITVAFLFMFTGL
eukprot:PhM_4_TR7551/c0_g1_i1/m.4528